MLLFDTYGSWMINKLTIISTLNYLTWCDLFSHYLLFSEEKFFISKP